MKLYVVDPATKKKIYLNVNVSSRGELIRQLGSRRFKLQNKVFDIGHVKAEPSTDNATTNAVVGGLLGIIGGPIGVIAGGVIGGLLGSESDKTEKQRVELFNQSRL